MNSPGLLRTFFIILTAWGVTLALRAMPFILFCRCKETPRVIDKIGKLISPLVIAGLIIYCYSSLEWKTCYPYLAGALTVVLQLLFRNSLVAILSGTILYMVLVQL